MQIIHSYKATNYKDKMETGCYAVNKNDYLNKVYIYNAGAFKQSDSYTVTGTKTDSSTEEVGSADYDS